MVRLSSAAVVVLSMLFGCADSGAKSEPELPGSGGAKADGFAGYDGNDCLFGDWWPDTMESEHFEHQGVATVHEPDDADELMGHQIVVGMRDSGANTVAEALDYTDDHEFLISRMSSMDSDEGPFTVYRYWAGDNPVGFIFTEGTLELVAEIGDDSIYSCTVAREGACVLSGTFEASGDFPSFATWTFELNRGELVRSYTDDLPAWEWRTEHSYDHSSQVHSLVQITHASDAVITTVLHFTFDGCDELGTPLLSATSAYTVMTDAEGSFSEVHAVAISASE